ncbi:hypothetical protein ACHAWO_010794 [Cyclotella atomus]|uniref:Uncharacterized protein n=1 Tax=Cyclotella atomus TaxID=382360 RepID=A0ABD3NC06_9STRA
MIITSSRRSFSTAICAAVAFLYIQLVSVVASSAAEALEAARFGPLPPTVFAPGGRLHGVERVAREAYPPANDESSCACIALRCGSGDDQFAIISGIGAISPFLHRDESHLFSDDTINDTDKNNDYIPLVLDYEENYDHDAPLSPLSIISPTVVVGVGGRGIDSAVLLRRAEEVSLAIYKSDNGGVEWFMSHSLEGISADSHCIPIGGAARVEAKALVRKLADMAQSSTQSLGSKSGRMLSSSLLAIGINDISGNVDIWRVDPTGQFWSLDAGAVGRAAIEIEAELLNEVRQRLKKNDQEKHDVKDEQQKQPDVSNTDVKTYLSSLKVEDALTLANDCIINGIVSSMKRNDPNLHSNGLLFSSLDKGLRKRLKTAIVRPAPFGMTRTNSIELVRG